MLLQRHARPLGGRAPAPVTRTGSTKPALISTGRRQRVGSSSCALAQWRIAQSVASPRRRAGIISQATATVSSPTSTILSRLPGSSKIVGGGPVILLGAQGLIGVALTKSLLESGQQVVAGVVNMEAAEATLAFVKKYELLDKKALDNLQLREIREGDATGLPKNGKFIIIEGDSVANNRTDLRFVQGGLATAEAANASKVVLVTSESGKSGTFFFFGGNNNTPNKDLTRTEKLVEASGIPATIVRAVTSEKLGEVMSAVLGAPAPPPGAAMVVEANGGPAGSGQPLRAVLGEALDLAQAKTPVPIQKVSTAPQGTQGTLNPLAALSGTVSLRKNREAPPPDEEDEKDGKVAPPKPAPATTKVATTKVATTKTAPKPVAKPPPPPPKKTVAVKVAPPPKKVAPPPKRAATPSKDEDDEEKKKGGGGLLSFLGLGGKPKQAEEAPPAKAPTKATTKTSVVKTPPKKAPPPPPKPAPSKRSAASDDDEEPKKPSGLAALFGLGGGKKKKEAPEDKSSTHKAASPTKKAVAPPPKGSIVVGTSKSVRGRV
ncbi:hypothetical protein DUNSADRAFT_4344 [Dunaliella salina]|uniref:Uncharacterized protein n=1 Tax=Dunaliella salina TaxID=3046 RepID=A0ABQ7H7R4_DUNSA|nr:hypothetical protein DUNSADRAFT_4344 [Dunaliella salina]|eukprot:KAF5842885.1 hypothetical protein DUNSADRAFT_4344 [Dunaliella salina]